MSDLNSVAPVSSTIEANMGGMVSRLVRPLVIDLTKDDDEPPPPGQQPLPEFGDLIRNNAFTPQPPPRTVQPSPSFFNFYQTPPPRLLNRGPYIAVKEPDDGTEETPFHPSATRTEDRKRKAIPAVEDIIDLTLLSPSPEPPARDAVPSRPSSPETGAMREFLKDRLSRRKRVKRDRSPRPALKAPPFKRLATGMILRSHTRANRLASVGTSVENPIEIPDDSVPVPVQVRVQAPVRHPTLAKQAGAGDAVLILFSDGSAIADRWGGSGVAFMKNGNWSGKAFALGQIRGGSWEAEARAIIEAFRLAGDLLLPHHKVVEVCSDHMGLVNGYNGFGRVRQAQDHMFQSVLQMGTHLTARGVEVKVTWVKGHDVYAGNEMADYLARLGARRSAEGHVGDAWNNPNLGELDVSDQALSTMSTNAESVALHRLLTKDERVVRREERRIHREKTRDQRRERKLQLRAERKKEADANAAADLRLT